MQINNINQIFNNKIQNINSNLPKGIKISNNFQSILEDKQEEKLIPKNDIKNYDNVNSLLNNFISNSKSLNSNLTELPMSNTALIKQLNLLKNNDSN